MLRIILKSIKIKQNQKFLRSEFADIFHGSAKIYFCRRDWTIACVLMKFWYFSNIALVYKILCLISLTALETTYKVPYTKYQISVYFPWMELELKRCEISK